MTQPGIDLFIPTEPLEIDRDGFLVDPVCLRGKLYAIDGETGRRLPNAVIKIDPTELDKRELDGAVEQVRRDLLASADNRSIDRSI